MSWKRYVSRSICIFDQIYRFLIGVKVPEDAQGLLDTTDVRGYPIRCLSCPTPQKNRLLVTIMIMSMKTGRFHLKFKLCRNRVH